MSEHIARWRKEICRGCEFFHEDCEATEQDIRRCMMRDTVLFETCINDE